MPGTHARGAPAEECLDALAAELISRGWTAYITIVRGRPARLFVQHPHDQAICADVMAAAGSGTDGSWFWFSWAQRITPVRTPAAAAAVIITELRRAAEVH